jgi:thiamine-phosphate pyrophosphorylase
MRLILLTPDTNVNNEHHIVNSLFANGLQRLHVRKPGFGYEEYKAYISNIDAQYHKRIVVCGAFELYNELGLGGVHLNSHMRADAAVWAQVAHVPVGHISTSFHSWQEVRDNERQYGYVFISPVFDSISKVGYKAAIDVQQCAAVREEVIAARGYCPQILGLGGVGAEQVRVLQANGFDGAALLGSVWGVEDVVGAFVELIRSV